MECRTWLHRIFCFVLQRFKTARKEQYSPTFLSSVEDNTGLDTNMAWITYCVRCILTCPWEKQILMLLNLLTWFKAAERKQRLPHVWWTCVQKKKSVMKTQRHRFFFFFFSKSTYIQNLLLWNVLFIFKKIILYSRCFEKHLYFF